MRELVCDDRPMSMPGYSSPCWSAMCAIIVATLSNVFPDWPSSVARHRMYGDFTGRATGSPLASQPANLTGASASPQTIIPASSDFARPLARDRNARRYTRRPVSGSSRYARTTNS